MLELLLLCCSCVRELLSATSSWAKATKTERQERHDESLHARNRICHVCAAQRCSSAVGPCLSCKQDQHLAASVCVERHDESLHARNRICLGPACRSDHEQDQPVAASVCVWKETCQNQTCRNTRKEETCRKINMQQTCRSDHAQNMSLWCSGMRVVTLPSAMSASAASFHVGLRSPKQNYAAPVVSFHVGPKRTEQR